MKVSILLADRGTANPQVGTLNLLNVGWVQTQLTQNQMAPGAWITPSHVVAVFFEVEHAFCNRPIELVLELLNEDGRNVQVQSPVGPQHVAVKSVVTVASPAMAPIGASGTGNAMVEIVPGLMIPPGDYRWNVTLAGEHHEEWFAAFRVLPAPQMPQFTFGAPVQHPPLADPPNDEPDPEGSTE